MKLWKEILVSGFWVASSAFGAEGNSPNPAETAASTSSVTSNPAENNIPFAVPPQRIGAEGSKLPSTGEKVRPKLEGDLLYFDQIYRPKESKGVSRDVYVGRVGDFSSASVEMTIDGDRFRIPRNRFSQKTSLRPGEPAKVRLSKEELKRFLVK